MRTLPLLLLLGLPGVAAAQSADRTGTWEAGFKVTDTSHEFLEGESGSSLDVEGELAWGFFGAYHLNEHFQLGAEITWSDPDYLAEFPLDGPGNTIIQVDAELDVLSTDFKATSTCSTAPSPRTSRSDTAGPSSIRISRTAQPIRVAGGIPGGATCARRSTTRTRAPSIR